MGGQWVKLTKRKKRCYSQNRKEQGGPASLLWAYNASMLADDYAALMHILSQPRLSGSAAERKTLSALRAWLERHKLPYRLQPFTLYPYFLNCIGLWMLVVFTLLVLSVWLDWDWWATGLLGLLCVSGGLLDITYDIPLVTWPGRTTGQNILVEFSAPQPQRELVISAHYDSKSELFDHHVRFFFFKNLRLGIVLVVVLVLLGLAAPNLPPAWQAPLQWLRILLSLPLLVLAWGLGLNMVFGRLRRVQSQGAVDNGAACAILLGLSRQLAEEQVPLANTRLTLALFGGEEVNMQGSRTFVRGRSWPLPAAALNLEIMAQDGEYVYWELDGTSFKLYPTDAALNQAVSAAVAGITGAPASPAGPINSDGYSFLRSGLPATTLGTYDRQLGSHGLHLPSDNLERVQMSRLPEGVEILKLFIRNYDQGETISLVL